LHLFFNLFFILVFLFFYFFLDLSFLKFCSSTINFIWFLPNFDHYSFNNFFYFFLVFLFSNLVLNYFLLFFSYHVWSWILNCFMVVHFTLLFFHGYLSKRHPLLKFDFFFKLLFDIWLLTSELRCFFRLFFIELS